jgi:acetamidase/formamidase
MSALIAVGTVVASQELQGRTYRLLATPSTVTYGYYDAASKPALSIESGDVIDVDTLPPVTPEQLEAAGLPRNEIQPSLREVAERIPRVLGPHILTGPVSVAGAQPGDVLEVRILSVDLAIPYGYNLCRGFLPSNCSPEGSIRIIRLDRTRMIGAFAAGIEVPLRPFFGSMGVAPPLAVGRVHSTPPGIHAGNIDNKELVAGATLFIPVHVPGALFWVGDGHAAQGDGEVDVTAIETSLRGRLQLVVRKGPPLAWPRAETPTHFISMGMDEDLMKAPSLAVQNMVDFLMMSKGLDRQSAYQLTSIAGDVSVTQLVDRSRGVHVKVPKSIFK